MKSLITNYGRTIAAESFKEVIDHYILIGANDENDADLLTILDDMNDSVNDFNINNSSLNIYSYLIGESLPIVSSTIDNERKLVFTINVVQDYIPMGKYVYAIALLDKDGNVFTINRFDEPFNSVNGAGEIITIKHQLLTDGMNGNNLSIIDDKEAFISRREFLDWTNNHNHDERYLYTRQLNSILDQVDQVKEDKSTIGNLKDIKSVNNTNIVNVLNEIIDNIGNLQDLSIPERDSLVNSINTIYSEIGNIEDIDITGSKNVVDALNKIYNILINKKETFKDGIYVEDVEWGSKADVSYVGDIDLFNGSSRGNIISALNEIYDIVAINQNKNHDIRQIVTDINYSLFTSDQDYSGTTEFSIYNKGKIVCCFSVDLNIVQDSIKVYNVFIDSSISELGITSQQGWEGLDDYIFGLALIYKDRNFSLSIKSNLDINGNTIFDRIKIDYAKMNTNSELLETQFSSDGSLIIREDVGFHKHDSIYTIELDGTQTNYNIFNTDKEFEAKMYFMSDTDEGEKVWASCNLKCNGMGDILINDCLYSTSYSLLTSNFYTPTDFTTSYSTSGGLWYSYRSNYTADLVGTTSKYLRFICDFNEFKNITYYPSGNYYFIKDNTDLTSYMSRQYNDTNQYSNIRITTQAYTYKIYLNNSSTASYSLNGNAGYCYYIVLKKNGNPILEKMIISDPSSGTYTYADLIKEKEIINQRYPNFNFIDYNSNETDIFSSSIDADSIEIYYCSYSTSVKRWYSNTALSDIKETKKISFVIETYNSNTSSNLSVSLDSTLKFSLFSYNNKFGVRLQTQNVFQRIKIDLLNKTERYGCINVEKIAYSSNGVLDFRDTDEKRVLDKINSVNSSLSSSISSVRSSLNSEISTRGSEDTNIRSELRDSLPVGTIISIWKFNSSVNSGIENYYLKCDGSLIPNTSAYSALRTLISGVTSTASATVYCRRNGNPFLLLSNKSIYDLINQSSLNSGISLSGSETVTITERYWDGCSLNSPNGDCIPTANSALGGYNRVIAYADDMVRMTGHTSLREAGNYYNSTYSSGNTTSSFNITDKITLGVCQESGNNCLYTIYNNTRGSYLSSSSGTQYGSYYYTSRNYDSKLFIATISNGIKIVLGFIASTSSDSGLTSSTYDRSATANYSFQNQIYLPDLTEEGVFLGGGTASGDYLLANAPDIEGSFTANNQGMSCKGSFSELANDSCFITGGGGYWYHGNYSFFASRCSSIYGRTGRNRLYPNHYIVEYWIKYK